MSNTKLQSMKYKSKYALLVVASKEKQLQIVNDKEIASSPMAPRKDDISLCETC